MHRFGSAPGINGSPDTTDTPVQQFNKPGVIYSILTRQYKPSYFIIHNQING